MVSVVFKVNGVFSGHTALQAASQNGHIDVVKLLISIKATLEIEVSLKIYVCRLYDIMVRCRDYCTHINEMTLIMCAHAAVMVLLYIMYSTARS